MELRRAAEVQEQTDFELGRAKVVVELPFRVTMQVLRRFDLEDHFVIDDHVESLMRDVGSGVLNEDVQFPVDPMSSMEQLPFERSRVNVLEKTEPQRSVHREERADH